MMKPSVPSKRLYLINRDFQLRYTRLALLVGLATTLLTVCLILFPLVQFRIIRFPNFLPAPFLWAIVAAALINFAIVAVLGILVTHRIAGPMFSMTKHMHVMEINKRFDFVRIRSSDDLKYLVRSFNTFIEYLRLQTSLDAAQVEQLIAQLKAGEASPGAAIASAEQLLLEMRRRL